MRTRLSTWLSGVSAAAVLMLGLGAQSATAAYPERTVTIIVPFGAGSATDTLARVAADGLSQRLGKAFVVQNKAGASGNIGASFVAGAKPDGYTLLVTATSTAAINHSLFKDLDYDPLKDFIPITNIAKTANVLVVAPSVPADDVAGLITILKDKELSFASSGIGGSMHLSGELFKTMTGGKMLHVAYKGSGEALADLLPGRVQMMFCNVPVCLPHIKSGKLKALAVTSAERSPLLPDTPTIAQSGLPGYNVSGWFGMFAPTGTDDAIVRTLNENMVALLETPEVQEKLKSQGAIPDPSSPEAFKQFVQSESDQWAQVIKEADISIEK